MGLVMFCGPALGVLFIDAPDGVSGSDALWFSSAIGFGYGLIIGLVFSVFWIMYSAFTKNK